MTGSRGDGASALLEEASRSAASGGGRWLVLAARAAPDERALDHALLQQLLLPLLDELDALGVPVDPAPRAALESAVGLRAPLPGQVPLAMAALLALEALARRRPVLLVVDDAQWADPASAAVLRFLSRRLSRAAVCLVLAAPREDDHAGHDDGPDTRDDHGWGDVDVTVPLTPLSRDAALAVVDRDLPDLDPVEREQLADLSCGRPRRLLDLVALTRAAGPDDDPLRRLAGGRAPSLLRAREELARCTPRERHRLLLLGLLDDPVGVPHLDAALASFEGAGAEGGTGLLLAPTGRLRSDRRDEPPVDRLLPAVAAAEATDDEVLRARGAWFEVLCRLAARAGTSVPADELTVRLGAEARRQSALVARDQDPNLAVGARRSARALRHHDARRAGDLFELSARVDVAPASRSASLLMAAEQALVCGRHRAAAALEDRARGSELPGVLGLEQRLRAVEALGRDDLGGAVEHLQRALHHLARIATIPAGSANAVAVAEEVLMTAAGLLVLQGRRRTPDPALEAAAAVVTGPAADRLASLVRVALPWDATTPAEQREAVADLFDVLAGSSLPVLRPAVDLARVLGRLDLAEVLLARRTEAQPPTGPGAVDLHLARSAAAADSAVGVAEEHLRRARTALRHAPGRALAVAQAEGLLDLLKDGATTSGGAPTPAADATAEPTTTETTGTLWATAHRHRLRGEMREAAALLSNLWSAEAGVAAPGALMAALPLAFALVESEGDGPALRRVATEVAAWARGSGAPAAVVADLLCRAVLTEAPEDRLALVEEAVRSGGSPVVAGPAELALGMLLRRARRGVAAREPLQRAVDAYEAVGHSAFAELARRELAATAPQRPPRRVGSSVLTSQERVVAELAATGASNAEIALSLGISSRTVAHHLQHVYARLGITGRQQLAVRLARAGA